MRRKSPFGRLVAIVFAAGFLFGVFTARAFSWNAGDETNVNSRYTVESVELTGASEAGLSAGLREELRQAVGQRFSPEAFARLSGRVRDELRARLVSPKLMRGASPDSVRVVLDVLGRRVIVSTEGSRLAFHSSQGWTGGVQVRVEERDRHRLQVRGYSDGDLWTERRNGANASYSHGFFRGRLRPGVEVEAHRASYDGRTLAAAGPEELYRGVDSFQPMVTFLPWRSDGQDEVAVEAGVRWQRWELQSPETRRTVASRALVNSLRYRRVRGDQEMGRTAWTVSLGLVNGIGGEYDFSRQELRGGYEWLQGASRLNVELTAGRLDGYAPFAERFAAGNQQLLRGWSKWEIAPLGANRLTASTVEYGHRITRKWEAALFVDSGSVWNHGASARVRTSTGAGIRTRDGFYFYVAFPLRNGSVEPTFLAGANF